MAIPKFRYVEYLDDGVNAYQCLSCYEIFSTRDCLQYDPWQYCPHCGIKWGGEHKWDQDKPRYFKHVPREFVELEYRVKDSYFDDKDYVKCEWQYARVGDPVWIQGKRHNWPLEEDRKNDTMEPMGKGAWKSKPVSKYTCAKWAIRYAKWRIDMELLSEKVFGDEVTVEARLLVGNWSGSKREIAVEMYLGSKTMPKRESNRSKFDE